MLAVVIVVAVLLLLSGKGGSQALGMFSHSAPGDAFVPGQGAGGSSGVVAGFGAAVGPAVCSAVGNYVGGGAGVKVASIFTKPCSAVGAQAAVGAVAGVKVGLSDIANVGKTTLNVIRNPTDVGAHYAALKAATVLPAKLAYDTTRSATESTIKSAKSAYNAIAGLF